MRDSTLPVRCECGDSPPNSKNPPADPRYRVGTLTYTKLGLAAVFFWLLWGDFCLTLMESVAPTVLPLKLNEYGAPSLLITMLLSSIPGAMNFGLTPILSFRSDRKRGRWGRRIPYLLFPTPFVAIFLLLLGFSEDIGPWLQHSGHLAGFTPNQVILGVISVMYICFQFFNLFITSIYYYLFNDVIPEAFLGRFLAMFRIVGAVSMGIFNLWVLPHVTTHMRHIFAGAAILYAAAFIGMCLKVKEGKYPPPPENTDGQRGMLGSLKTFWNECFMDRRYQLLFLAGIVGALAWPLGNFEKLWSLSLGLSLTQIGQIAFWTQMGSMLLMYPTGAMVDRWHPIWGQILAFPGMALGTFICSAFLMHDFSPNQTWWLIVIGTSVITAFTTLYNASSLPLFMRVFPRDRFGQFCAANSMLCALSYISAGVVIGWFMGHMKDVHGGGDFYLRYMPFLRGAVWAISAGAYIAFFLQWRRNGWLKEAPSAVADSASQASMESNT